jgi:hypothetical protein
MRLWSHLACSVERAAHRLLCRNSESNWQAGRTRKETFQSRNSNTLRPYVLICLSGIHPVASSVHRDMKMYTKVSVVGLNEDQPLVIWVHFNAHVFMPGFRPVLYRMQWKANETQVWISTKTLKCLICVWCTHNWSTESYTDDCVHLHLFRNYM